jgi:peptide/nickel transport system substrate-binding protein
MLITVSACSLKEPEGIILSPGDYGTGETGTVEPVVGGTLRIPMNTSPYTMHPLYVKEAQMRNVYSMIFEPLVAFNDRFEPAASIAESWKYDEAQGAWVLQLRANVHWHGDNGEVTGFDAAYTVNAILSDPESIYYTDLSYYVSRAEGYGNTLIIYPKVNSYNLIYALNIPVIPQSYYSVRDKMTRDIPVGSGSYKVDELSFEGGTRMSLSVFTKWWKKLPYIEKIEATGYNDTQSMLDAFKAGQLDVVPASVKTTEVYEILDGVDELNYVSHNYVFLGFNLARNFVEQTEFRKAIAYSLNRTDIINNVYLKKATGAELPLFNDTSLSSASVTRYDHNLVEAKECLEKLGYRDNDGDGYIDGIELSLLVVKDAANPIRLEAAEYIRDDLKKAGIKVNVDARTLQDFKKALNNRSYDMVLSGYYLSDTPNLSFIFSSDGSGNLFNYSSQECQEAFNAINSSVSLGELKNGVQNLQKKLTEELPQIGMFFEMNTLLYSNKLSVTGVLRETNVYSQINNWYFKEK